MTRDEIVTALREHAERAVGNEWGSSIIALDDNLFAAADLIENQQRHIEALLKANDSLKDAIAWRDKLQGDLIRRNAELLGAKNTADQYASINDSLKDAIARRDKQIEDIKQGMAQLAKAVAVKEEKDNG